MRLIRRLFGLTGDAPVADRRQDRRRRTRLRPGKVLDDAGGFLSDCAILDRSNHGLRLQAFGRGGAFDAPLRIFDEKDGSLRTGCVVWTHGTQLGIRLNDEPAEHPDADDLRRIAGPYYAVGER